MAALATAGLVTPGFVCIDHAVPEATTRLLRAAAEAREVSFTLLDARSAPETDAPLAPGSLLYRAGTSLAAMRLEQALFGPGVASFHSDPEGPHFGYMSHHSIFARAGIPIPRILPLISATPAVLRSAVQALGGYPVIVKLLGHSRGVGTIRVDSAPSLLSLADWLQATGQAPFLMAYVPDAVHWRTTVVGGRALGCYRNVTESDDFRTAASADPGDYAAEAPAPLAQLAIAAVRALRLEFGGVDILEHAPSGRLYVLEANMPCYYAQAQEVAGIDIAGAMLDHLLAKSARLLASTLAPDHEG